MDPLRGFAGLVLFTVGPAIAFLAFGFVCSAVQSVVGLGGLVLFGLLVAFGIGQFFHWLDTRSDES